MNLQKESAAFQEMVATGVEILKPRNREANPFVKAMAVIFAISVYPMMRLTGETPEEIQSGQKESREFFQNIDRKPPQLPSS